MNFSTEKEFDVIVVGSGIGGLVCATKLQKSGKKVLLVEQHSKVGGYCTNFKRKGYEFDSSIHWVAGCEPGGWLHNILVECGVENEVGFIRISPTFYKGVYPDRTILIPSGVDDLKETLSREFPEETENVEKFFEGLEEIYDPLYRLADTLYFNKKVSKLEKALFLLKNHKSVRLLLSNMNTSLKSYVDDNLKDSRVRGILLFMAVAFGVEPSRMSLLTFAAAYMMFYKQGFYYIDGGSQALSNAFAKVFQESGGTLLTNTDVKRIIIESKAARGVEVEKKGTGEKQDYYAKVVVSNADPTHTYLDLVGKEHLSSKFTGDLENLETSFTFFTVYLGVDMELPEDVKDDYDIFAFSSYDSEEMISKILKDGLATENRMDIIAIYSNVCPQLSPEPGRKHVIGLSAPMNVEDGQMEQIWKVSDVNRRGEEYKHIKESMAEEMLERVDRIIPGIKENIEVMEIGTPVTMERYTRNKHGAVLGWKHSMEQMLHRRMKQKTPIKNLYLGSAWTLAGGVNGAAVAGCMAADKVMKQL